MWVSKPHHHFVKDMGYLGNELAIPSNILEKRLTADKT